MLIVDEKDQGKEITLSQGEEVEIILFENPGTGYQWKTTSSNGIELIENRFERGKEAIGSGGHHHWMIRLKASGKQQFEGSYLRPWEKSPAAKKFDIVFNVTTKKE